MPKVTLSDIALHSGVSLATVDRVMNDRSGVSERTRKRVFLTAERLGYVLAEAGDAAPVHLAFVLPEGTNAFVHDLARQVAEQAPRMRGVTALVDHVAGFDPAALAETLYRLQGKADGIAIMAVDHPAVRQAVRSLVDQGTAIVTLGSDVRGAHHLGYIGIDDAQAGRLAGYLLGRLTGGAPSQVAFFAGSLAYRGHLEREMGFRQILREEFPHLEIVEQCEVQDSRAKAETAMKRVLASHPDLRAVYNAGGGTAGIAAALEGRQLSGQVVFIAHDATDGNKALLLRGTLDAVIDQNARVEVREALTTLAHAVRKQPYTMVPPRLQIIFRENLPAE